MNRFRSANHIYLVLIALFFCWSSVFGSERTELRLKNPFILPQLNFVVESASETVDILSSSFEGRHTCSPGDFNKYGLELETNMNEFTNIGLTMKLKSLVSDSSQSSGALLGGFARFFYIPEFLKYKYITASLFTRVDLSTGPMLLISKDGPYGAAGIGVMGGISVGSEVFVSKWFGLGLSYSKSRFYGVQGSNVREFVPDHLKDVRFSGTEESIQIYLKSTYY